MAGQSVALRLLCLFLVSCLLACEQGTQHEQRYSPPSALSAQGAAANPSASASPRLLDPVLQNAMKLAPRKQHGQKIAFGTGTLAVVEREAIVVRDAKHLDSTQRFAVTRPERIERLADGSLLVLGAEGLFRLGIGAKELDRFARPSFFTESVLVAHPRSASGFWILHAFDPTLYAYELRRSEDPLMPPKKWIALEGYDRGPFASLVDGSVLYSSGAELKRSYTESGRVVGLSATIQGLCRILAARTPERAWLLRDDGSVELVELGTTVRRVALTQVNATPYDADAIAGDLAVLSIRQPNDAPKSWQLDVFDERGTRRFAVSFPAEQSTGTDWVEALTRNAHVAVSADLPLVAVGGPERISVWDRRSGDKVFSVP